MLESGTIWPTSSSAEPNPEIMELLALTYMEAELGSVTSQHIEGTENFLGFAPRF